MSRTVDRVPDDRIIAKPAAKVGGVERMKVENMQAVMKQKFAEEPQVPVRIREEDGSQFVQINGYSYRIFPSENYVKVPQSVADELRGRGVI